MHVSLVGFPSFLLPIDCWNPTVLIYILAYFNAVKYCVKSIHIRSYSKKHFPTFRLNTERYSVSLHVQSEGRKMRIRTIPDTLIFYALKMVGVYLKLLRNNRNKFPKSFFVFFFYARFTSGVFRTLSNIWDRAFFISSKQLLAAQLLSQLKLHLTQSFGKILNTPLTYSPKTSIQLLFLRCFKRAKKHMRRSLLTEIQIFLRSFSLRLSKPFWTVPPNKIWLVLRTLLVICDTWRRFGVLLLVWHSLIRAVMQKKN